jgi:hypothetical protein
MPRPQGDWPCLSESGCGTRAQPSNERKKPRCVLPVVCALQSVGVLVAIMVCQDVAGECVIADAYGLTISQGLRMCCVVPHVSQTQVATNFQLIQTLEGKVRVRW